LADEVNTNIDYLFNNSKVPDNFVTTFKAWHTNLKLFFLNRISDNFDKFTDTIYKELQQSLNITSKDYNMEVECLWYQLGLDSKHTDILPLVDDFLGRIGRMKFIRPMYISYAKLDRDRAIKVFYQYM